MDNYSLQEPWKKVIIKCQNEITSLDPHLYYINHYKKEELYCWQHIPKWIYEYGQKNIVNNCLDIGCAYGTLALYCKKIFNCGVYCTDFVDVCLSKSLIEKYNFIFSLNNIELDPFPWDISFDVIIFSEILEHLNFHPLPTLRKIYGILSQGGRLYLSTPDASEWGKVTKYYSSLDEIPNPQEGLLPINDHIYVYNENELVNLLNEAGFKIEKLDYSQGVIGRHFNLTLIK